MQPMDFGKFIVQIIQYFWTKMLFVSECKQGEAIIKFRLGKPVKWRNKPQWYCKWPIIDEFEKVDIRKRYLQINAHSFHSQEMEKSIIPYNIVIDVQIEYQIINPLIILYEYGFAKGEEADQSVINNIIQGEISEMIIEKGIMLSYVDIYNHFKETVVEHKLAAIPPEDCCKDDIRSNWFIKKNKKKQTHDIFNKEKGISINDVVITSFDKNISLRTTV